MDMFKKIIKWIDDKKNFIVLLNILMICIVAFLLYQTFSLWQHLFHLFIVIVKPFFFAFVIAYVFEPFVHSMTKRKLPRALAIALVIVGLLGIIAIFTGSLIPLLYNKVLELIPAFSNGLMEVQELLWTHFNLDISDIVIKMTDALQTWIMNLSFMNTTLGMITNLIGKIGTYIIYLILAVYFLADYQRIRNGIKIFANRIHPDFAYCLKQIDLQLIAYIQAFLILMIIQMIVYGCIYLIIGHPSWLLLGLLSGLACIFPYIGPMSVNVLGVITALGMPPIRIILLLVAIFIQSNVDSYIITPKVYSSRIEIEPVYVIFSLLTGSALLGPTGIIIAMPMLVIGKIVLQTLKEFKTRKPEH